MHLITVFFIAYAFTYFTLGLLMSKFDDFCNTVDEEMSMIFLWPAYLLFLLVYYSIAVPPYLFRRIKSRLHKRKLSPVIEKQKVSTYQLGSWRSGTDIFVNCMDCPFHKVIDDPDPKQEYNPLFRRVAVVCTRSATMRPSPDSRYAVWRQELRPVTVQCMPHNVRKESSVPKWCPLVDEIRTEQETKNKCQD